MTTRAGPSVLALVGDWSGPSLWRVLQPFTALQKQHYRADWDFKDARGIGQIAPNYDGYVLPRMSWPPGARPLAEAWFRAVHGAGRFVVFDADDDLFSSGLTRRTIEIGFNDGRSFEALERERLERLWVLAQCDGVTVSTQRLATIVRSLTEKPVIVVPNAIDLPWFRRVLRRATRQIPPVTIGWAGGQRPDRDVERMAEAWGSIARRYSSVTFVTAGFCPPVVERHVPADRLVRIPWLPLERYPEPLVDVDIGCCAVADEPFNRAKSVIKAYEYAVAGAAVVASATLYGSLLEHGRTGYVVETVDDWETALSELVASESHRRIVAKRLLRVVEKRHALDRNLWRWPAAWAEIAEKARARRVRLA